MFQSLTAKAKAPVDDLFLNATHSVRQLHAPNFKGEDGDIDDETIGGNQIQSLDVTAEP